MMQKQAKLKSHPNISTGEAARQHSKKNGKRENKDRYTNVFKAHKNDQNDEK